MKLEPHSIGLTGSIGMGKSTVAGYFSELGVAVWDADEAVHRLYGTGQKGSVAIQKIAPRAVVDRGVDRSRLSAEIRENPELLEKIEAAIHPLVAEDRAQFRKVATTDFILFDIPLLFEGGMADQFDTVVVVSAPFEVQKKRVLARPGMTLEKFDFILSKQMKDVEKRKRADFVVETDRSFEDTKEQVTSILQKLGSQ